MRTRVDSERSESAAEQREAAGSPEPALDLPAADPKRYRIDREQGRGGLGCVYAAHDTWLDRQVAVKRALDGTSRVADARFVREALVASRLQHPGIVPVYDAGRYPDGEPYYAMKLVGGRSLGEAIHDASTLAERLGLVPNVLAVSEAIAYAHDQGIIHRDLKPANVMLGEFGETVVVDWGLARDSKLPDEDSRPPVSLADVALTGMTNTGAVLGTPGYMSPEQARGDEVDERADVYALGAILYNVVAGRRALDDRDPARAIARAIAGEVPTMDIKGAPPELCTIAARAMAPRLEDRYGSAKEVADDLRRFLTGQLVASHDYGLLALARRFVRRHKAAVVVGGVLAVALAVTAIVSTRRIIVEKDRAEARGDALTLERARSVVEQDPAEAIAWLKRYPLRASDWEQAYRVATDARSRGVARHVLRFDAEIARLETLPDGVAVSTRGGVRVIDPVRATVGVAAELPAADYMAGNADTGDLLVVDSARHVFAVRGEGAPQHRRIGVFDVLPSALAHVDGDIFVVGDRMGAVELWSLREGRGQVIGRHDGGVIAVASAGGGRIASLGLDRKVRLSSSDGRSSNVLAELQSPAGTRPAASWMLTAHPGSGTVAYADGPTVHVWRDGVRRELGQHYAPVTALAISPDGERVASGSTDLTVRIWSIGGGPPLVLTGHSAELKRLAFSPTGVLASVDQEGGIWVWYPGGFGHPLRGHRNTPTAIAYSRDGAHLVTGDISGEVRVWSVSTGLASYRPDGGVWSVAPLTDGRVAATSPDGTVRVWSPGKEEVVLGRHDSDSYSVVASETDARFVTGGWDGMLHVWDPTVGEIDKLRHGSFVWAVAASSDLSLIAAAGGADNSVTLWNRGAGMTSRLSGHIAETVSVALSSDASRLVSSDAKGKVMLWNTAEATGVTLAEPRGQVIVAFALGGRAVVGLERESGAVRLWNVETGSEMTLGAHAGGARGLTVSADQTTIATGGEDGVIRVWNAETGELTRELHAHTGEVRRLAFSPSGDVLASAGWDSTVRLWDVATGAHRVHHRHGGDVFVVAFSRDGAALVSCSRDGSIAWAPLSERPLPLGPAELRAALAGMTSAVVRSDGKVATPRQGE